MKRLFVLLATTLILTVFMSGCSFLGLKSVGDNGNEANGNSALADDVDSAEPVQDVSITENIKATDSDSSWDAATSTKIILNGNSVSASGSGAAVSGGIVTITDAGTYVVSGILNAGQILIATDEKDNVRLVLNGVKITADKNAAIYAATADKVVIILADGTENTLTDASSYTYADATAAEPNATLFSKCDLSINGTGKLTVGANFKHGIATKDDLVIASGNITVNAVSATIRGKDSITVLGGTFNLTSKQGDGIHTANETETDKGWILIKDGSFTIKAYNDGIQAATAMQIDKGTFNITAGQGVSGTSAAESYKGVKADNNLVINGGTYTISSSDDCIHSNADITITDGSFTLESGDDGIHADKNVTINADINIKKSYEGIEATNVVIDSGTINIVASDDGINGAGGNSTSTAGGRQQDHFSGSTGTITINGGMLTIAAAGSGSGDGMDANGDMTITGGSITFITPPGARDYEPFDHDGTFSMTSGEVIIDGKKYDASTISSYSGGMRGGPGGAKPGERK